MNNDGVMSDASLHPRNEEIAQALKILAATGGPAFVQNMIGKFCENFPDRTERLAKAISSRDGKALSHEAHNLKSVVAVFGARKLAESLKLLETYGLANELDKASALYPEIGTALTWLRDRLNDHLAEKR